MTDYTHERFLIGPRLATASVAAGVALALGGLCALSALARPPRFDERLAALQTLVTRIGAVRLRPGDAQAYPLGAICSQGVEREAVSLRERIERIGHGLPILRVTTSTLDAQQGARIHSVGFRMDANGDYPAAVKMMQGLGAQQPSVLLSRVDLTSRGSFLHMHLEGRVLCWATATS